METPRCSSTRCLITLSTERKCSCAWALSVYGCGTSYSFCLLLAPNARPTAVALAARVAFQLTLARAELESVGALAELSPSRTIARIIELRLALFFEGEESCVV